MVALSQMTLADRDSLNTKLVTQPLQGLDSGLWTDVIVLNLQGFCKVCFSCKIQEYRMPGLEMNLHFSTAIHDNLNG